MTPANSFTASNAFQAAELCAEMGWRIAVGEGPGIAKAVREGAYYGAIKRLNEEEAAELIVPLVYDSLEARSQQFKQFDAFVACPGGYGTLFEVSLVINLMQRGEMARKPLFVCGSFGQALDRLAANAVKAKLINHRPDLLYSSVSWPPDAASRLCHSK